jgi:methionine synthase I (cobalamin-dependent)
MVVAQAKAKYSSYPNPAASHWVHERYVQSGGKFIDSNDASVKTEKLQKKQFEKRAKKAREVVHHKKGNKKDKKK